MLRGDEVVVCPVLGGPKPTAEEMLGRKTVRDRVILFDAEQQTAMVRLHDKVKGYEGQPALCSTPVFSEKNGSDEKNRAGSSGSDSGSGSLKRSERECPRKE